MQKLEMLQRKIKNAEEVHSIVRTMKVMAAVEINQFEQSVESIGEYFKTLEMGLQIVLKKSFNEVVPFLATDNHTATGIIILGSGQSLCGPFDETILSYVLEENEKELLNDAQIFVLGERLSGYLGLKNLDADLVFQMPGSVSGINKMVLELLSAIEKWQFEEDIRTVKLFHHRPVSRKMYKAVTQNLLPLNKSWLEKLMKKKWPTNHIPSYTIDSNTLFMSLLRQYLFVSLYRAVAESLTAEYSSRLTAMQRAEVKIDERIDELSREFTHERQSSITEELLDIMAGFESANLNS